MLGRSGLESHELPHFTEVLNDHAHQERPKTVTAPRGLQPHRINDQHPVRGELNAVLHPGTRPADGIEDHSSDVA